MEYYLLAFVGILFGTIVMLRETKSVSKRSSLRLINVFGYLYGVTYGFFPACAMLAYTIGRVDISHSYYRVDYSLEGIVKIAVWMLFGIFGYLVVHFSYGHRFFFRKSRNVSYVKRQQSSIDSSHIDMQKVWATLQVTMIICFVICVISLFLWTWAYGGLVGLIMIADKVRDGVANVQNPIAFFARPAKMILISFYMALVLVRNRYNTFINFIFLSISFVLSTLMLLALDGRFGAAMHVLSTVLLAQGYLKKGAFSWKKIRIMLVVGIIDLIGILNMDKVTFYIRNGFWKASKTTTPFIEDLLSEFTYIITGAQQSIGMLLNGECPYLIGHDILAGAFSWWPSSLRPDGIIDIWDYNTELCTIGSRLYGQLPCDFITTSVYSLGLFGPLVYGFFWGWVMKRMDLWYLKSGDPAAEIFYCTLVMRILKVPNYHLLYDFVLGLFSIVLAAFIWWGCKHMKLQRINGELR